MNEPTDTSTPTVNNVIEPIILPSRNPNGFDDPYANIPAANKNRTTIDISANARADISAIYTKRGVLQTTINILLEKLRQELKKCNLTSYNPEAYEIAVAQCEIRLGGFNYERTNTSEQRLPINQPSRKKQARAR